MFFLAVTGNKRHGVALIEHIDDRLYLFGADGEFVGDFTGNVHIVITPCVRLLLHKLRLRQSGG